MITRVALLLLLLLCPVGELSADTIDFERCNGGALPANPAPASLLTFTAQETKLGSRVTTGAGGVQTLGDPTTQSVFVDATRLREQTTDRYFPAAGDPDSADQKHVKALTLRVVSTNAATFVHVTALTRVAVTVANKTTDREIVCFASDAPANRHDILLPSWFKGRIEISREDVGAGAAVVTVGMAAEPLQVSDKDQKAGWFSEAIAGGASIRKSVSAAAYAALVSYASCDYLDARQLSGCRAANLTAPVGELSRSAQIYRFLSETIGRNTATEFGITDGEIDAAHSEPIIAFFGLADLNRVLQLDCREKEGGSCLNADGKFAEPWHTTLQHSDHAWFVYVEDAQAPFDTSIDIEFRRRAPSVEYEEFDPSARANLRASAITPAEEDRQLRVGVRRIRLRDAPISVVASFTRRGPNYGVRTWTRTFAKTSDRWWAVAATIMVPAFAVRPTTFTIVPEPRGDAARPATGRLTPDESQAWLFTAMSFRLPGIRARAIDQPGPLSRFALNLVPDYTIGVSLRQGDNPYVFALSWPVFADTVHTFFGFTRTRKIELKQAYGETQLLPLDTDVDTLVDRTWDNDWIFGVSIDVLRSK